MKVFLIAALAAGALGGANVALAADALSNPNTYRCAEGAKAATAGNLDPSADVACRLALEKEPLSGRETAMVWTNRGLMHALADQLDEAISNYGQALRYDPDFAAAYTNRAGVYLKQSRYKDAFADADRAIGLDGKSSRAYYTRAVANEMLGRLPAAYVDYNMAARLDPTWDRPKQEMTRFRIR